MIPPVKTAAEPAYSVLACSFFWGACSSNQRPLIIRKIIKLKRQLRACMLLKARDCCYDANDLKSATLIKSLLPPSNICDAATWRLPLRGSQATATREGGVGWSFDPRIFI